eukprot:3178929-Amphidinium_carterae.1
MIDRVLSCKARLVLMQTNRPPVACFGKRGRFLVLALPPTHACHSKRRAITCWSDTYEKSGPALPE